MIIEDDFPSFLMSIEARLNSVERELTGISRKAPRSELDALRNELGKALIKIEQLTESLRTANAEIKYMSKSAGRISTPQLKFINDSIGGAIMSQREEIDVEIRKLNNRISDTVEKSERASRVAATAISDSLISYAEDFAYGSVN